mmetsp:Transcript_41711/g.96451  ORF Transcript_41711/g.96451 Transcript_41711/m.96451 type:complete len:180 (+) Transcript_41711:300-839(+)
MAQVSNMASGTGSGTIAQATSQDLVQMLTVAHMQYSSGRYTDALSICETIYSIDAYRTENLLLLGAIHFQLRNFSECIFYNQQCIRVDPNFAEAYSVGTIHKLEPLLLAVADAVAKLQPTPRNRHPTTPPPHHPPNPPTHQPTTAEPRQRTEGAWRSAGLGSILPQVDQAQAALLRRLQ